MSPSDKLKATLEDWMANHRTVCTSGEDCCEPLGILAWLFHCSGCRVRNLRFFRKVLREYEKACPDCAAHDRRN